MWIQYGSGSTTLHLTVHVNCLTAVIFICPDFSARDWAAGDFPPHCPASRQGFPRGSEPAALHLRGYQCRQDLHHPGQRQSLIRIQVNFEQWTLKYEDGIMLLGYIFLCFTIHLSHFSGRIHGSYSKYTSHHYLVFEKFGRNLFFDFSVTKFSFEKQL